MRWIQRIGLSAAIAAAAVGFLVVEGIFAAEDAMALFAVIASLMLLMRPERFFHPAPNAEPGVQPVRARQSRKH